ncbi:hypothetical protein LEP1GSC133_3784 [Leptospira borgpetersenii serovar Pomona str. 200901868]|uniref:Uncharacterized protein n=1 Tax=Leptospira borgpetersenii serovar Pomona str. 200901868 TaxID=1192866 RepID=M6VXQ1_LEPBO|nr:hypothetical protein LEP1GSC133_3784 [Leptospira borgpetersenii serovar Pomona str. 200901868]
MNLSGANFPENGKPFFQGDFQEEHSSLENEILNRFADLFAGEVISGGEVTIGQAQNTINVSETVAYDLSGKRVKIPAQNGVVITRQNSDSVVVLRHRFQNENSPYLDSTGYANAYRRNSFELLFKESVEDGDISLFKIRSLMGTVSILEDVRSFRRVKEENIRDNSITNIKLIPDIKIGSLGSLISRFSGSFRTSVVGALNALANWLTAEESARQSGDTSLQNQINSLGSIFAPINHSHSGFASVYVIAHDGGSTNFTNMPNADGVIVVYRISCGPSGGQGYSIHGHNIGGIAPVGGFLFGVAARAGGSWVATTG